MTINPLSVSFWNDLADPVFDGVGLAGFKSRANAFYWPSCSPGFLSSTVFPSSSFLPWVGIVGLRKSCGTCHMAAWACHRLSGAAGLACLLTGLHLHNLAFLQHGLGRPTLRRPLPSFGSVFSTLSDFSMSTHPSSNLKVISAGQVLMPDLALSHQVPW